MSEHKDPVSSRSRWLVICGAFLITATVIVSVFFAYQMLSNNVQAQQNWNDTVFNLQSDFELQHRKQLEANLSQSDTSYELTSDPELGEVFGVIYAPRLWPNGYGIPIYEGTSDNELYNGIGHYEKSELPGEIGNFAIAGHRATHGQPFAQFELFEIGDEIQIETVAGVYTYSLVADQIVKPSDVWVTNKRPKIAALENLPDNASLITLTTCEPKWSSEKRWIWFGVMKSFEARTL